MMRLEELNPFWSGLLNKMGNYRKIWVCRKCGQTIFSAKRPIKCVSGICDSISFVRVLTEDDTPYKE